VCCYGVVHQFPAGKKNPLLNQNLTRVDLVRRTVSNHRNYYSLPLIFGLLVISFLSQSSGVNIKLMGLIN